MISNENENRPVTMAEIENVEAISPHNKAMYEAGKSLLIDSIATAREFCSAMIGISTGAIPIYLGILSYLLPEDYALGVAPGILLAAPAIGFLAAAVVFIFGYLPIIGSFSLDIIEQIEAERKRMIRHRRAYIIGGVTTFTVSTVMAIVAIIINIGVR